MWSVVWQWRNLQQIKILEGGMNKSGNRPSIWVDKTERSSSPCMRPIVRRRASVTSLLALVSASSLSKTLSLGPECNYEYIDLRDLLVRIILL